MSTTHARPPRQPPPCPRCGQVDDPRFHSERCPGPPAAEPHRLPPRDLAGEHAALAGVFRRHLEKRYPGHHFVEVERGE